MVSSAQYFCYVEPNRLSLVGNNAVSLVIPLASDLVSDLEMVDREKLIAFVGQLLQANSILPGSVTFLLAPENLFEQDLSAVAPKDVDTFVQKFTDSVPFETVASKRISVEGKLRLVAANKDIIDGIEKAFEKKGFTTSSFVPYTVIQATIPELAQSVDPGIIFSKLDSFRQYSFTEDIVKPTNFEKKTGLKGRRDMILLGVFGVLMVILVFMVLFNFVFVQKPAPVVQPTTNQNKPVVFPTQPQATQSGQ